MIGDTVSWMSARGACLALVVGACSASEPTSILVRVEAPGLDVRAARATIAIGRPADVCDPQPLASGRPIELPGRVVVLLDDAVRTAFVTIAGETPGGCHVAAAARIDVTSGEQATTTLVLESDEPLTCCDGLQSADEQAIDCGGPCAACDLATGPPTWRAAPALLEPRSRLAAVASPNGRIYAIGGESGGSLDTIESLSPLEDPVWRAASARLPSPRSRVAAASTGTTFIVAGGRDTGPVAAVERVDGAAVAELAAMALARESFGLVASDGLIYAIGGNGPAGPLADVEVYDERQNAWFPRARLPAATQVLGAAAGRDGAIYVFGGRTSEITDAAWRYDPALDRWGSLPALVSPRIEVAATLSTDGRIYTIGGQDQTTSFSEVTAFTPRTGRWSRVSPITPARVAAAAVTGCDGRVWSIGGTLVGPFEPVVAVYGPEIHVQPASAGAATLTGDNFAANAEVRVWFGAQAGTPVATGRTDETGHLVPISLPLPAVPAGAWPITAIDDRSRIPVTTLISNVTSSFGVE